MSERRLVPVLLGLAIAASITGLATAITYAPGPADDPLPLASPSLVSPSPTLPVIVAVGDIACPPKEPVGDLCRHRETAKLTERLRPDAVLILGDLVYPGGSPTGFEDAYAPAWGALKDRTHPAPGNHEYLNPGAAAYFRYWGARAGPGWYSFDVAGWHLVSLNSNCATVGCGPASIQGRWLQDDLAENPARCTLAYWHHARWSSGLHGSDFATKPLWDAAQAAGVDVVLVGHDHHYERFAPLDPAGRPVPASRGIREFVVGTGGRSLYPLPRNPAGSEKRIATSYGVLALRLAPTEYSWEFIGIDGVVRDAGTAPCR